MALAIGLAGFLATSVRTGPDIVAEPTLAEPDLMEIDKVLANRAPELGLALRRRVAEAILDESKKARFDPMMVLGLIETESAFVGDAVSIAGARGLMQLMPVTLEHIIAQESVRLTPEEIYRDPAMQVRLAVRYLSKLEKRFRSLDLALMAYNGGPGRLEQALQEGDAEAWFGNYVRTVKLNQARIRRHLPSSLAQIETARLGDPNAARLP
ncbi:MAG: lytic transglycosylase domain-containing protein [Myxococcales bacterium]